MKKDLSVIQEENDELFEHHRIIVDPGQAPMRIDKFLFNRIENISRNKVQQAAKSDSILVNEKPVKSSYNIKPDDIITIVLAYPPRDQEILPENIPIDVVYEDADVIVLNKQAGLVVHPGHNNYTGTLLNGLAYYFNKTSNQVENGFGYLVHRIDKDTTGLLVVAKNEIAQTKLAKQFYLHTVKRTYTALAWGDLNENEGTITGHIGRSLKDRRQMTVFPDGEYGKEAVTHFKVIQRFGYVTLVNCRLETGRTHQIRAHFKYIGHPLFNDERYGGDQILKGTTFTKYKQFIQNCFKILPRQALHAQSLGFVHPTSRKKILFESTLPNDMGQLITKWENYITQRNIDEYK